MHLDSTLRTHANLIDLLPFLQRLPLQPPFSCSPLEVKRSPGLIWMSDGSRLGANSRFLRVFPDASLVNVRGLKVISGALTRILPHLLSPESAAWSSC